MPEQTLQQLRARISRLDLAEAARRLDGRYSDGKLTLKILGKDFSIDTQGRLWPLP